MSSFPAGSIASSLNFDTSKWTGGFAEVISSATSFPGMVASNLDAPMAEAAAAIGASAQQAGAAIQQGIQTGVMEAAASVSTGLNAPMDSALADISAAATEAGAAIHQGIDQGIQNSASAISGKLPPAMQSAAHSVAGSAHEAGHAIGHEIEEGMLSAEAAMKLFPALVIELIENPILGAVAAAKEALEALGEVFEGTAAHFHKVGLESEKLGMDPDVFSAYAAAAKASGIEMEQFGNAIKFMEDRAANALRGDEGGAKAFADLGIKAKELKELLAAGPQEMLLRIADAMKGIENPAMRAQAAMDMGRPIADMIPFLVKGSEEIDRFASELGQMGAGVTEDQVKMGENWGVVEAKFGAMWQYIKDQLSEPIFGFIAENADGFIATINEVAESIGTEVVPAMENVIEFGKSIWGGLSGIADLVGVVLVPIFEMMLPPLEAAATILKVIVDSIGVATHGIATLLNSAVWGEDSDQANASRGALENSTKRLAADYGWGDPPDIHVHQNITVDADGISSEIARKTLPAINKARDQLVKEYMSEKAGKKVAHAMGGRHHH